VPIAIYGTETGSEIAVTKPTATVWLYGTAESIRVARAFTERIMKAVRGL
jgi:hypothetical protein